jgi:hypothetical protein
MDAAQIDLMRRLLALVMRYAEPVTSGTGDLHNHVQRVIAEARAEIKQAEINRAKKVAA